MKILGINVKIKSNHDDGFISVWIGGFSISPWFTNTESAKRFAKEYILRHGLNKG